MTKSRILIVEDEALVAADLQDSLTGIGYEVVGIADNALDAQHVCLESSPDLALLDIQIRGPVDGLELSTQLGIPFIFLTAHADLATLERATSKAPYGYIVKPFDDRELQASIESALGRYRAEKKLRNTAHWLATTLGSIGDGVITCDRHRNITFINAVAAELIGCAAGETLGEPLSSVFRLEFGSDAGCGGDVMDLAFTQGDVVRVAEGAQLRRRHAATPLPVACCASPIPSAAGDAEASADGAPCVVIVFRDRTAELLTTQRKLELEARLLNAQRLESLGSLAGGMAHRFNNLLAALVANTLVCQHELPSDSATRALLDDSIDLANQGASLCRQILAYSGRAPREATAVDVNRFVVDAMELLRASVPKTVSFSLDLAEHLPKTKLDVIQLQQVLTNLVTNGANAMERQHGQITLRTGITQLSQRQLDDLYVGRDQLPGERIVLEVEDTGHGMAPEVCKRAFEPFFSTRPNGAGLGLAAVEGVLRAHNASLDIQSTVGKGTVFRVYLPIRSDAETRALARERTARASKAMIVETNPSVRSALGVIVSELGLEVEVAASISAAALQLELAGEDFRLLVLDANAAGSDGWSTIEKLRRRDPELKVAILSGHAEAFTASHLGHHVDVHIRKPFSREGARSKLSRVLSAEQGPDATCGPRV